MPTLFQQLENNESMLLLYLAGELPAEDMKEVEQMLARDAGLRAELESIRATQQFVFAGLADLDRAEAAAPTAKATQATAVRNVGRMMRQWQVDRLTYEPVSPARARLRMPGWTYPVAAVASVLIVALIFWGHGNDNPVQKPTYNSVASADQVDTKLLAQSLSTYENTPVTDAESQASSIIARSDDASVTNSIFFSENGQ